MAKSTFCVACAQLPAKDRSLAVKMQQCADCKMSFGVTSYGSAFRVKPARRIMYMTPSVFTAATLGAGLFMFVVLLTGMGMWSHDQMVPPPRAQGTLDTLERSDLTHVPEVAVDDPFPQGVNPRAAKQGIADLIQRIRTANSRDANKKDAFVVAHMDARKELRGMPFIMGDACRSTGQQAVLFQTSVEAVRHGMDQDAFRSRASQEHQDETAPFWNSYMASTAHQGVETPAGVAALTQILGPERGALRTSMVQRLAHSNNPNAIKTIAKAAIFDVSSDTRLAAIKALKNRKPAEYTDVLMHGMRYPLGIVANRTAQAIIVLDRKDLLPQLAEMLDEPAPGDPQVVEGKHCVREVVRINHHRNCLLCHPPSTPNNFNTAEVPGLIPIPGESFPSMPSQGYGNAQSIGEPMVRADTTYLRQDFSVRMPVENAAPWPEQQRFDFLVRTRVLEDRELTALQQKVQARPAGFQSENQKAAVRVLRELTGQQNVAATKAAWQRVLAEQEKN